MDFNTLGLGAGSYPDAPAYEDFKTVELDCSFTTYVSVPASLEEYEEIKNYINETYSGFDLVEDADTVNIEDIK